MIWWVYQNAQKSRKLNKVYVVTDNKAIYNYCAENKINVLMTGPQPTGTDRIAEAAEQIEADYYVNIQGDEPLISPSIIDAAIHPPNLTNLMCKASNEDLEGDIPKVVVDEFNNELIYMSRYPIPAIQGEDFQHMKQVCVYGIPEWFLEAFHKAKQSTLEKAEQIEILRFVEMGLTVNMIEVDSGSVAVDYPEDIKKVEKILNETQ